MSRAKVRPAVASDIETVCRLLHEQMNRRLLPERWRRITSYGWLEDKPDFGRVVDDGGRIVGFVGSVYADREIRGRRERVVSMSSWYLDKAYRGQGLGFELMGSATADDSATYTMITVSPRNLAMLPKLGYRILDHDRHVWSVSGRPAAGLEIEQDVARILARVGSDSAPDAAGPCPAAGAARSHLRRGRQLPRGLLRQEKGRGRHLFRRDASERPRLLRRSRPGHRRQPCCRRARRCWPWTAGCSPATRRTESSRAYPSPATTNPSASRPARWTICIRSFCCWI